MPDNSVSLAEALAAIAAFDVGGLTGQIASIEAAVRSLDGRSCEEVVRQAGVTRNLLASALAVKRAAGQINVAIHAFGILLLLPKILELDERVEYVSLGAGNTGRLFDLETDRRVAEFKFIHWRGGSETIRQNALFKDFYLLAEHDSPKQKQLFVLGTSEPLKFLNGGRSLRSVLSRNTKLGNKFRDTYDERFAKVRDYYAHRQNSVAICDAAFLVPELNAVAAAEDAAEAAAAKL